MTETGWLRRLGPWVGIGTSPAALMVGGGVAEGNERWWLAAAIVVGVATLAALAAAQGLLGQRRQARLVDLASRSLGRMGGRRIASPVLAVMMVGWFGFNPSVAGAGLGRLGNLPDRAGMVIFATIMLAVAWHGLNVLSWTALAAGLATVLLAAEGVHLALSGRTGPLLGDGHPAAAFGQLPAIAIMVGYGAAFALRTPDFTHDLARPRHVVWCAAVGLALPHRRALARRGPGQPDGAGLPPARDLGVGRRCRNRRRASRRGLAPRAPRRARNRGGDRGCTVAHGTPAPAGRHVGRPDVTWTARLRVRGWRCCRAC